MMLKRPKKKGGPGKKQKQAVAPARPPSDDEELDFSSDAEQSSGEEVRRFAPNKMYDSNS